LDNSQLWNKDVMSGIDPTLGELWDRLNEGDFEKVLKMYNSIPELRSSEKLSKIGWAIESSGRAYRFSRYCANGDKDIRVTNYIKTITGYKDTPQAEAAAAEAASGATSQSSTNRNQKVPQNKAPKKPTAPQQPTTPKKVAAPKKSTAPKKVDAPNKPTAPKKVDASKPVMTSPSPKGER
jgi:hypothetical protein